MEIFFFEENCFNIIPISLFKIVQTCSMWKLGKWFGHKNWFIYFYICHLLVLPFCLAQSHIFHEKNTAFDQITTKNPSSRMDICFAEILFQHSPETLSYQCFKLFSPPTLHTWRDMTLQTYKTWMCVYVCEWEYQNMASSNMTLMVIFKKLQ